MIVDTVRPRGWSPTGTHTGGCHSRALAEVIWRPCSACWGQGRILEQRPGDMTYAHTCATCLGVGTVPASERTWQVLTGDDTEGIWP